ncbi:MAG: YgfZ/GcvT domain-containing protein [Rhodanobacteraceae bacterium]
MASDPNARAGLGDAQCLEICGEDAHAFAQAQFSGDVLALQPMRWQWNAWLDHKGAVRALMHLADPGDGRLLALLRGGDANELCADLRKYVLRAKVRIEPLREHFLSIGAPLPLREIRTEAGAMGFGCGERSVWVESARRSRDAEREHEFRLDEIRTGWPRLPPGSAMEFLPPALGLEHLGAVSFDKGCYPGQEIAARLHYRGGHKRRLVYVSVFSPMHPGDSLPTGTRDIVLESSGTTESWHALAVMDEQVTEQSSTLQDKLRVIRKFEA